MKRLKAAQMGSSNDVTLIVGRLVEPRQRRQAATSSLAWSEKRNRENESTSGRSRLLLLGCYLLAELPGIVVNICGDENAVADTVEDTRAINRPHTRDRELSRVAPFTTLPRQALSARDRSCSALNFADIPSASPAERRRCISKTSHSFSTNNENVGERKH